MSQSITIIYTCYQRVYYRYYYTFHTFTHLKYEGSEGTISSTSFIGPLVVSPCDTLEHTLIKKPWDVGLGLLARCFSNLKSAFYFLKVKS